LAWRRMSEKKIGLELPPLPYANETQTCGKEYGAS
jgi:hypothetical protein